MKRPLFFTLVYSSALLATEASLANDSLNVHIKANVVGTCQYSGVKDMTLDFGNLNETSGDQSKSGSTQFWCSKGVSYAITGNNGLNAQGQQKRLKSGTNFLNYGLDWDNKTGTGGGSAIPVKLNVTASIKGADLQTAILADKYSDTVVLTINP